MSKRALAQFMGHFILSIQLCFLVVKLCFLTIQNVTTHPMSLTTKFITVSHYQNRRKFTAAPTPIPGHANPICITIVHKTSESSAIDRYTFTSYSFFHQGLTHPYRNAPSLKPTDANKTPCVICNSNSIRSSQ